MKKLNVQEINTEIHTYNLRKALEEPKKTWEGRNNIDKADMAVLLSTVNPNRREGGLDILITLLPIFLRRWRMEIQRTDGDGREEKRIYMFKTLFNLQPEDHDWRWIKVEVMWENGVRMKADPKTVIRHLTKERTWLETMDWKITREEDKKKIEILLDTFPKEKK